MERYTYEQLLEIIAELRSDHGCPWDRAQTHESMIKCLYDECDEVVEAIENKDDENLCEELGDVLLQVLLHAQIAAEEGRFTMADVVDGIARKMVRRHPHVFGSVAVDGSAQVLENWEEIKKKEKEGKTYIISPLQEIPRELPALTRATKVIKKVDKLYEPAPDYSKAVQQLQEAANQLAEMKPSDYDERIADEIGKILMTVSNISRLCKLSPEQLLTDRIEGMIDRFEKRS